MLGVESRQGSNKRIFAFGRGGGRHIVVVRSWRVFHRIDYCDTWSGNIPVNTLFTNLENKAKCPKPDY